MLKTFIAIFFASVMLLVASAAIAQYPELLPPISDPPVESLPDALGPPIIEESYPSWTEPSGWFDSPIWEFGMEVGINGSEGNAQAMSLLASYSAKRETESSKFAFDVRYGRTKANQIETQHYSLLNSRWDWNLNERWFWFSQFGLEYDEFKAFDLRLTTSGGLGYHFIKNDVTTLSGRMGAGVSREFGGPDDDWIPEAVFGLDYEHKISERQKIAAKVDYYPSWENFSDYRLISKVDWEVLLDDVSHLSLKIGAVDRYDSTPNGAKANDIDYYVTLLWKL